MSASPPIRDAPTHATSDDDTQISTDSGETLWQYAAAIVHYDDASDECTIYPTDVEEWELVTTWISAQEGSYVSLAEMC